jgi:hypothetical protein
MVTPSLTLPLRRDKIWYGFQAVDTHTEITVYMYIKCSYVYISAHWISRLEDLAQEFQTSAFLPCIWSNPHAGDDEVLKQETDAVPMMTVFGRAAKSDVTN